MKCCHVRRKWWSLWFKVHCNCETAVVSTDVYLGDEHFCKACNRTWFDGKVEHFNCRCIALPLMSAAMHDIINRSNQGAVN